MGLVFAQKQAATNAEAVWLNGRGALLGVLMVKYWQRSIANGLDRTVGNVGDDKLVPVGF